MPDIKEKLIDLLTGYSLDTYEDVQYVADELIAKGVLPVVRCKDCKHMTIEPCGRYCHVWGFFNGAGDEGFCNYGERKDGEG